MQWPWIERSIVSRYGFAAVASLLAALAQWGLNLVAPGRVPFLLFLPLIVLATTFAGRGPGLLVVSIGAVNAALQMPPVGLPWVTDGVDRVVVLAYLLVGLLLVGIGSRIRSISRRQYADLQELHDLSAAVAATPDLKEQLHLILQTLARLHGTDRGLVAVFDSRTRNLKALTSLKFSDAALANFNSDAGIDGACGEACLERRRVVIEDVTTANSFAPFRELAAREGFRAVHCTPLVSPDGEILGALGLHFTERRKPTAREMSLADICATRAAVAIQRAQAEDSARRQEQRFETVLESSAVPFTIMSPVRDGRGNVTDFCWSYVNAAAAKMLRHPAEELLEQCVRDVLPGTWDEPGLLAMYAEAVDSGRPLQRELRSVANGIEGWFQIVASPLDGMLAIWFADITFRKQQEEMLKDADRRKDEFLATLAHELRNPLAPIRQAAQIAHSDRAGDAQKRWSFSVIERQVRHMSLLLDDLLDVSRITRGTLTLRKQQVELASVINAAVETARPIIDSRHHQLNLEIPKGIRLIADPLRLAQIVGNLLTNAAKYTEPGGQIRVVAEERNRQLTIRVEDTGIGLREEDLSVIFTMFSQAGRASEHAQGGLGIGLALTKGLVEMHGGSITARSPGPGKGSVFTVLLPVGEVVSAGPTPPAEHAPRQLVKRRVLIADDNIDAADSLAVLLRLEGHEVEVAHDGEAALQLFDRMRPDVALLDIGMPLMDGHDLARRIRAHERGATVLLIAITGWGQEKDRRDSLEAGFDLHLTKPVEPESVARLIQRLPRDSIRERPALVE